MLLLTQPMGRGGMSRVHVLEDFMLQLSLGNLVE